jgi:hypothetical protein
LILRNAQNKNASIVLVYKLGFLCIKHCPILKWIRALKSIAESDVNTKLQTSIVNICYFGIKKPGLRHSFLQLCDNESQFTMEQMEIVNRRAVSNEMK